MPNGRCYHHGGATPKGPALPQYKDGKRSKYQLPPTLTQHVQQLYNDPELLSHRRDLATIVALNTAKLAVVLDLEWLGTLREAATQVRTERTPEALNALLQAVDAGGDWQRAVQEWVANTEQARRLRDSEVALLTKHNAFVAEEKVLDIIARLVSLVNENVKDRGALSAIAAGVKQITG